MQCLDAAVKKHFDAHAADYKEVHGLPTQQLNADLMLVSV